MDNMHKLFVPYGVALELRKHGFDEPCLLVYHQKKLVSITNHEASTFPIPTVKNSKLGTTTVAVPMFQQVLDWLRETHKILISPFSQGTSVPGQNIYWIDVEYMDRDEAETIDCDVDYNKAMIKVILVLLKELKK